MGRARFRLALAFVAAMAVAGWLHDGDEGGRASAGGGPDFSGVYDVLIHDFQTFFFYHCVAKLDHDVTSNAIDALSVCYADDVLLEDPNAEPREHPPGEGPDGMAGPGPPPPYNWQAPYAGGGAYTPSPPGNESLTVTTCMRGLGSVLGPNALTTALVYIPETQLAVNGHMEGQVDVYPGQGSGQCASGTPAGPPSQPWSIDFYPIDDVNGGGPNDPAAWRTLGDDDFDNDGCSDEDELTGAAGCGDDPYSALDLASGGTDVSGNYLLTASVVEADACWGGTYGSPPTACSGGDGTIVPGYYYMCVLDLQQAGTDLTGRTYCYVDSPAVTVHPQVAVPAGSAACPPASAQYCGDGLVGAAPPGRTVAPAGQINFGDIDDAHAVLNGELAGGQIELAGCIEDRDGMAALGHVHVSVTVDAHSGQGDIVIADNQTEQDCTQGTLSGAPPAVAASMVRQAHLSQQRDTDSDGCPDGRELEDNRALGGLRDPFNHYDYFNPTGDGLNRVDDILAVLNQYFLDDPPGQPDFSSLTDRTGITGSNEWNLGPPNGQQRVDDILSSVKQYFNDC